MALHEKAANRKYKQQHICNIMHSEYIKADAIRKVRHTNNPNVNCTANLNISPVVFYVKISLNTGHNPNHNSK